MHNMNNFNLIILLSLFKMALTVQLPSYMEKCHFGDSKCLVKTINDFIRHYPKGVPEIGLPPLDVISVEDISTLETQNNGPIWLNFYFKQNVYKGFNNATVLNVEGFNKSPMKNPIVIKARIPSVVHEAIYNMQGRYLLFVANTTGELHSDFQNITLKLTLKVIEEYRYNKRYLKVYDLVPRVELDRWIVWMDNLYKENMDLTVALNHVMNKHWVEFWNGIEPTILQNFALCFTSMLNKIFDAVSYDDMFLPDQTWED